MHSKLALAFTLFTASLVPALSHVQLTNPESRSLYPDGSTDYAKMSPLSKDRPYPCGGHKKGPVTAYSAGQSITLSFVGDVHNGGYCQISISYDGGANFVVVSDQLKTCTSNFQNGHQTGSNTFTMPKDMPPCTSDKNCILAWTWINNEGNREFYTQCVDVNVNSNSNAEFLQGPEIFVPNLNTANRYPEDLSGGLGTPQINSGIDPTTKDANMKTIETYLSQRAIIGANHGNVVILKEACYNGKVGAPNWRNKQAYLTTPSKVVDKSNGQNSCNGNGWKFDSPAPALPAGTGGGSTPPPAAGNSTTTPPPATPPPSPQYPAPQPSSTPDTPSPAPGPVIETQSTTLTPGPDSVVTATGGYDGSQSPGTQPSPATKKSCPTKRRRQRSRML